MNIYIMRGLPGSGKSKWIKDTLSTDETLICSADHYRINEQGIYVYDPKKDSENHMKCFQKFLENMETNHVRNIVVDNTNLRLTEFIHYYRVAEAYRHSVEMIRIHCDPIVAFQRNQHGVAIEKIFAMNQILMAEVIPPYIKEKIIV